MRRTLALSPLGCSGDAQCPLWVVSRHLRRKKSCPLCPQKRTYRRWQKSPNSWPENQDEADIVTVYAAKILAPSCRNEKEKLTALRTLWDIGERGEQGLLALGHIRG